MKLLKHFISYAKLNRMVNKPVIRVLLLSALCLPMFSVSSWAIGISFKDNTPYTTKDVFFDSSDFSFHDA